MYKRQRLGGAANIPLIDGDENHHPLYSSTLDIAHLPLMMQIDVRYQNVILRVNHMEFAQVLTFVHAKLVGKSVSRYDVRYDVRFYFKNYLVILYKDRTHV